jgi:hypothetical protein
LLQRRHPILDSFADWLPLASHQFVHRQPSSSPSTGHPSTRQAPFPPTARGARSVVRYGGNLLRPHTAPPPWVGFWVRLLGSSVVRARSYVRRTSIVRCNRRLSHYHECRVAPSYCRSACIARTGVLFHVSFALPPTPRCMLGPCAWLPRFSSRQARVGVEKTAWVGGAVRAGKGTAMLMSGRALAFAHPGLAAHLSVGLYLWNSTDRALDYHGSQPAASRQRCRHVYPL